MSSGTRELYRYFSLPIPILVNDANLIRLFFRKEYTDQQLIQYLETGKGAVFNGKEVILDSSSS